MSPTRILDSKPWLGRHLSIKTWSTPPTPKHPATKHLFRHQRGVIDTKHLTLSVAMSSVRPTGEAKTEELKNVEAGLEASPARSPDSNRGDRRIRYEEMGGWTGDDQGGGGLAPAMASWTQTHRVAGMQRGRGEMRRVRFEQELQRLVFSELLGPMVWRVRLGRGRQDRRARERGREMRTAPGACQSGAQLVTAHPRETADCHDQRAESAKRGA